MVNRKHLSQNVAFGLFRLLSLSVVGILFAILGFIIYKGIGVIDWEFLTTAPTNGMTAGGIQDKAIFLYLPYLICSKRNCCFRTYQSANPN